MANFNKPSDLSLVWSSAGDVLKPSDSKIASGWSAEIPPRQWFNYIDNKQDQYIAHSNQHGIAVWDSITEYQAGSSYTQGSDGKIYFCLTTNVNQNPTTDTNNTYWVDINSSGQVVITASGNFTVPAILRSGLKKAKVIVTAGGGAGGNGVSGSVIRGGGGGAGGTSIEIVNLAGVSSVACVVGQGGSSINASGGSSNFGSYLSATGGAPGNNATTTNSPAGGDGGVGSGGDMNLFGGDGSDGPVNNGNGYSGSGDGGASYWGGGARGSNSTPRPAKAYGSGAGGSVTGVPAGANGVIVIEW